MPTENRSSNTEQMIPCDDGLHLIQLDENLSHYGWVFRKVDGGLPYSVRKATEYEMAHAKARQHLRAGATQIAAQYQPAEQHQGGPVAWTNEATLAWMGKPNSGYAQVSSCAVESEPVPLYRHPPTSDGFSAGDMADQGAKAFRDGVKASADLIQKRMDDYLNEFGALDPETGSVELPRGGDEYVGELSEIIEAVRSLPLPQ